MTLVSGFTLDTRMWDAQFEEWANHWRVIRYDRRGTGRSAPPDASPYAQWADLRQLLDELNVQRTALVGMSQGGEVAIDFTLTYPERVEALVIVGGFPSGNRFSEEFRSSFARMRELGDAAAAKRMWLAHPLFTSGLANERSAATLRRIIEEYPGYHFIAKDPARRMEPPARERLAEIRVPTLVVVGEHDIPDMQLAAERLAEGIAGARKVVIAGAGHAVNMERPEEFNRVIEGFLGIE